MIFAIAVFAPLFGSLISGLFGRWLGDRGAFVAFVASPAGEMAWMTSLEEVVGAVTRSVPSSMKAR